MKGLLFVLLPLVAVASPIVVDTIHNDAAPLLSSSNAVEIPDNYIIVFKKHVTSTSALAHHSWVQDIHFEAENTKMELRKRSQIPMMVEDMFAGLKHTYDIAGSFLGYSGHFDESVVERIRRHPDVSTIASEQFPVDVAG